MHSNKHPHHSGKIIDYSKNPFIVIWEVNTRELASFDVCTVEQMHKLNHTQMNSHMRKESNLIDQIYEMDNPMLVFYWRRLHDERRFI